MPSRTLPCGQVNQLTLEPAVACGAIVIGESGVTDVALARNLVLGRLLERVPLLSPVTHAIWVDDDTIVGTQTLWELVHLARATGASISARYAMRTAQSLYAATLLDGERWLDATAEGAPLMPPVYAGLGCLAVSMADVRKLAGMVPTIRVRPHPDSTVEQTFPAVMQTGPVKQARDDFWSWCSEDHWFCERLWSACNGVFLSHHEAGHLLHGPDNPPTWPTNCQLR